MKDILKKDTNENDIKNLIKKMETGAFDSFYDDFLMLYAKRLLEILNKENSEKKITYDIDKILFILLSQLKQELIELSIKTLILEFEEWKKENAAIGLKMESYKRFNESFSFDETNLLIFDKYPVLKQLIYLKVNTTLKLVRNAIINLSKDLGEIRTTIGKELDMIVSIETDLGDSHNGGKSVLIFVDSIKMAGMEKHIYKEWNDVLQEALKCSKKRANVQNIHNTLMSLVHMFFPLLIFLKGISLYFLGEMTLGGVAAFYSLSETFFSLNLSIFQAYNNYILTTAYLERVRDITMTSVEKKPSKPITHSLNGEIELRNVSFAFTKQSRKIINNVLMNIKKGQKIAIVGKSGAGKSTLGKIILGLYEPTEGKILYDGFESTKYNKESLRSQMGMVPQEVSMFNKSIYDNIKMNLENIERKEIEKVANIAQISKEIEEMPMGYNTYISEMGANLSGGQRQRIALARALLKKPKMIILDEATSSLDAINEKKVEEYLRNIKCTRIVIAHRLSTIIDADIIYVMDNGSIIEAGAHFELIKKKGLYYELYNSQIERLKRTK